MSKAAEIRESIESTIASPGYQMILAKLNEDLESTRRGLDIFTGLEGEHRENDHQKGIIQGLNLAIDGPGEIIDDAEKEEELHGEEKEE